MYCLVLLNTFNWFDLIFWTTTILLQIIYIESNQKIMQDKNEKSSHVFSFLIDWLIDWFKESRPSFCQMHKCTIQMDKFL